MLLRTYHMENIADTNVTSNHFQIEVEKGLSAATFCLC